MPISRNDIDAEIKLRMPGYAMSPHRKALSSIERRALSCPIICKTC